MKKIPMILVCIGMIGLLATSGFAALSTTLTNPDFEDVSVGGPDSYYESVDSWGEGGSQLWQETGVETGGVIRTWNYTHTGTTRFSPVAYTSSDQIVMQYWDGGATIAGTDMFIFQSLGTVESTDVGWIFTLSADFVGSSKTSGFDGSGNAFFATGTVGADEPKASLGYLSVGDGYGDAGTIIGTAGTTAISYVESPGSAQPWQTSSDASWTVSSGDIGTEIFAVLQMKVDTFSGNPTLNTAIDTAVMSTEAPPVFMPGDVNLDGIVGMADATIIIGNQGMTGALWGDGDLDLDGTVDVDDYNLVDTNWGNTTPPEPPAVPEPTTLLLLAGAGVVGLISRRRKGMNKEKRDE